MSRVSLKDARAGLSVLIDQASKGEFVTITRHGKPAAVLVGIEAAEAARKAMHSERPNFGEYIMRFPGGIDLDRSQSKMR
ncbi:type II toxin-antitoxin system prevent-host-death family antitoxin [Rhizobium sp. TH2]|uniref:type II toxin-antitoxin system Phd/YefM family antitoxin n=1 Tax=Rhizobium sp. TH2 TaxID=2775403 RepID=UPI002157A5A8|nr:type II toxin-antitoxin system prevent-host-death family antitoxin [Rhizobium sp. TH2]UVC07204.1 type II toxin-antitoxin system prevent-host-death family antitoxin [Rhizobium sp. TH2]